VIFVYHRIIIILFVISIYADLLHRVGVVVLSYIIFRPVSSAGNRHRISIVSSAGSRYSSIMRYSAGSRQRHLSNMV